MAGCPDAETLAAYLDGQLFPEQRDRLEEHSAGCEACGTALAGAIRFQSAGAAGEEEAEGEEARAPQPRRHWAAAAALVILPAATVWFFVHSAAATPIGRSAWASWRPWERDPRAPLIAATTEERPMLPRLTGGYRWAPASDSRTETLRAVSSPTASVPWAYYAAAEQVRQSAVARPDADRLAALADAHMLAGDLDRALVTLARAMANDPADPRLRSDVGAAYLARGQLRGTAADLALAVEMSSAALAADPSLIEARFNRALALEELHLNTEARRAWQSYLAEETDPQWAAEAKRHLHELDRAPTRPVSSAVELRRAAETGDPELPLLVAAHRFNARRLVEWELLPEWGAAVAAGERDRAARALAAAAPIAQLYSSQTGDDRLAQEVAEATAAKGAVAQRLAAGHRELAAGEASIERVDGPTARDQLSRAVSWFPLHGVGWRRATVELLIAEYVANGFGGDLLAAVERRAAIGGDDLVTRARLAWLQGMVAAQQSQTGKAIARYLQALATFDRLGETELVAWVHFLLSEVYTLAGDERSTWQHRSAAVTLVPTLEDRRRSAGILRGVAMWSALQGRPWLADAFLDELTANGDSKSPYEQAYLHLWRARLSLQLDDRDTGVSELARAALAAREVASATTRDWIAADLAGTRAVAASSPGQVVAAVSRALATFHSRGTKARLPGLLLQRSLAYRADGNAAAAERDLREGIAILEQQRRFGHFDELWLSGTGGAQALYDQMIAVELGRGRSDQAFLWSERARRRALALHAGSASALEPVTVGRVGRDLDAATTLLSYALIGDEVRLWQIDSRGSRLVRLPASAREISSWVATLDADLAAGEWTSESAQVARSLHAALIAPANIAAGTSRLVIVPDKGLTTLPFSVLIDNAGSHLVQSYAVEIAPSAAFYLHARDRWRSLAGDRPSALVLGDPRADETLFPGLTTLPGAAEEARRVAELYPGSVLITREQATRDALVEELGKHAIVHLATHALVDDTSPSRSSLALAARRPGDGSGALFADEIASLPLARTRTLVLASCGGIAGPLARPEGRVSLPYAFLSADVPTVVVSLWPVGDRRSVELLAALHTRLRAGDDPASALRYAQLRLLDSRDPRLRSPATWALFQALGG